MEGGSGKQLGMWGVREFQNGDKENSEEEEGFQGIGILLRSPPGFSHLLHQVN
jgi:hypothetical protein